MRVATEPEPDTEPRETDGGLPALRPEALGRLLNALPAGVAMQDAQGRILWANHALGRQTGLPPDAITGLSLEALPIERVEREDGVPLYHLPRPVNGQAEWIRVSVVRLPDNGVTGLRVVVFEDVTQTERFRRQVDRLQQALHGQVATDEATGLLNRRGVMSQLEAQVSRSRRYNNVLSVVMLRLRGMGGASDPPSLQAVLSVSRLLRDQTRWPDIIGRWNEQDFVLVLPETSGKSAGLLRDKLQARIAELYPVSDGEVPACAADFGVAEWQKGDNAQGLIERAGATLP